MYCRISTRQLRSGLPALEYQLFGRASLLAEVKVWKAVPKDLRFLTASSSCSFVGGGNSPASFGTGAAITPTATAATRNAGIARSHRIAHLRELSVSLEAEITHVSNVYRRR